MPSSQPISKVDNIQCRLVSWYYIGWNICDILLLWVVTGTLRRFTERLVRWFASRDCKAAIRSTGRFHDWKAQLFGDEITIKKLSIYLNSTPRYITKWGESLKQIHLTVSGVGLTTVANHCSGQSQQARATSWPLKKITTQRTVAPCISKEVCSYQTNWGVTDEQWD